MKKLEDFVDAQLNKRVFIFGTGPTLNDVTEEQVKRIEQNEVSMCINFSHIYLNPTYWLAGGHATQIAYAIEHLHSDATALFHCGFKDEAYQELRAIASTVPGRINFIQDQTVSFQKRPLTRRNVGNTIIGGHNIILSATHLAYLMGAKEIVFVGFEQTNRMHFYNLWPDKKQEDFKKTLRELREKYNSCKAIVDCVGEILNVDEPDEQRWCHFKPIEVCKNLTFKPEGKNHHNYPIFKNYVEQLQEDGVRVYTTATEGICVDAGCEIVDLEDMLK